MEIVCDVDGVVADLLPAVLWRYNRDYDDKLTVSDVKTFDLTQWVKPQCGARINDYFAHPGLYDDVPLIAGALDGVRALRAAGHDLLFASSCYFVMTDQKAEWLTRHELIEKRQDLMLPHDFVPIHQKWRLTGHLLIDDGAHNVDAWVKTSRPAILFRSNHNAAVLSGHPSAFWRWCRRADDWAEVVRHVQAWS